MVRCEVCGVWCGVCAGDEGCVGGHRHVYAGGQIGNQHVCSSRRGEPYTRGNCTHLESTDAGARVDQFALRGDAGAHAYDPDAGAQAAVVGQLGEGAEGGVRLGRERETGERV